MKGKKPQISEQFLVGLALYMFAQAFPYTLLFSELDTLGPVEENPIAVRFYWAFLFCILLVLVIPRTKYLIPMVWAEPVLAFLIFWAFLSVFWSISPADTLRRSFVLFGTTLFGMYLAERFALVEILRLLAWCFSLTMILSWILALAVPELGTTPREEGINWRGAFGHKNKLGQMMLFYAVILWYLGKFLKKNRWGIGIAIGLSMLLILLSGSKTQLVIFLALVATYFFIKVFQGKSMYAVSGATILVMWFGLIGILVSINIEPLLMAMGRDLTLTGRAEIWLEVMKMIQSNFFLGYGYDAFWLLKTGPASVVWDNTDWEFFHSHNGFLELWLDLGLIGLLAFLYTFHKLYFRGLMQVRARDWENGSWTVIFLTFFFLINVTETHILQHQDLLWVIFVANVYLMRKVKENEIPSSYNR